MCLGFVGSAGIAVCLLLSAPCALAEDREEIRIGAILPLTGEAAEVGAAVRGGLEIALDGLAPEVRAGFSVMFEDDVNAPRNSVSAFRRLAAAGATVMVSATAQPSMALAPLSEELQIPLIAIAVPARIVQDRHWAVLFFAAPERMAQSMKDEAVRRGYKRLARINSIHDGREAQGRAFDEACRGTDLKIVLDEEYLLTERDFRTFVTKLRLAKNIDGVYANLFLGHLGVFARQLREGGVFLPLFTSDTFIEDRGEQRAANGALREQWYVSQDEPEAWFTEEYKRRFPDQTSFFAANGHDVVMLLARALKEGAARGAALNTYLHSVKHVAGALGTFSATEDNRFDLPVAVKSVTAEGVKVLRKEEQRGAERSF